MRITPPLLLAGLVSCISMAAPVPLLNPSGEINNGIDKAPISGSSVLGWGAAGGTAQVIEKGTDYGNGKWRMSIEDSAEVWQMTSHPIAAGDAFSLRFDAAMFAGSLPGGGGGFVPNLTLVGAALRNGNFNADTSLVDSRSYTNTPEWFNLAGNQNAEATRLNIAFDGSRNAVLSQDNLRQLAIDTGHTLATGEEFQASFVWRDASGWTDGSDRVGVTLYTTSNDLIDGPRTEIQTLLSPTSTLDNTYEQATLIFAPVPVAANGKRLFSVVKAVDGDGVTASSFGRLDNFTLQRGNNIAERQIIAELYVDNSGARLPVASRTYDFKTPVVGSWDHYHLAVPAGTLDGHVGKTVGVRFRSNNQAIGNFQSFDNVKLDVWPSASPDGSFSDNWNNTPDQTWAGPGYWANRLQDWEVRNNRVQCINGARERLTLHRPGTSIRGNGQNFSFGVRTGLNTGSHSAGSRAGFLIGSAPNVEWQGALLVHDGLGRDFGLFLGITGDGNLVIEDYSTGAVTALASAPASGGFAANTRLNLAATYNSGPGSYTLTLTAFNSANTQIGTINVSLPSDRVLGAFGLLNHPGSSLATHWFDDFSGSGAALNPEPDRHLAILGAMHTLSKGKLKLTAQLSPLSLVSNPTVALETWNGSSWINIATASVDNTDGLSSYTATFTIPNWNDSVDTDYRLRVNIGGSNHDWTGTIRRDPVEKEAIVIAMTTCQRINDGNMQNDGFDWSPVMLWQPHTETYANIVRQDPDLLLAHGDQIYENQPTTPDKSSATKRQLDYLYKWNLWVLQVRDLTRDIPTVAIPDDHDVFQGNLWGEGGKATGLADTGGYVEPASWVKMVERTQTSNLPDADPYNPIQPAPPANATTGIGVYFTGMTYGRLGFAILEDRKFKTGKDNPPVNLADQHLLGERQHDFLRSWNEDWGGQDMKLVVSQSPLANFRTHASVGYGYFLNDQDTHGWPIHRRNEAWRLLRASRMFQLAGDQHLGLIAHNGADAPRDAGISFTAPAIANFFPRVFDPVNNASGTTPTVSPYKGDFYFNGVGTLPDGVTPNRSANFPHHFAVLGSANSLEYYEKTSNINPANLHDRGAGYGITRVNRTTREITFECWPIHSNPDYPTTGGQFADWPQTFRQSDNDGRAPTGYLPLIDTLWRSKPVVRVFDETSGDLVHAMRIRGTRYRPPVYDNGTTYRVEIAYDDAALSETRTGQTASVSGPAAIRLFRAVQSSIVQGASSTLEWDVASPATLTINQGIGNVMTATVDGMGYLEVSPTADTTYSLTLNGVLTAQATVRVFPGRAAWNSSHFSPAELNNPTISGGAADPDGDGFTNDQEYQFQTHPRNGSSEPRLQGEVRQNGGALEIDFECSVPLAPAQAQILVETSTRLDGAWTPLPSNSYVETGRENFPVDGTSRVAIRLNEPISPSEKRRFYRARWEPGS